ncbi:Mannose-6-phosphate isomerase [Mycoemilia scoparia]|uniref:Mannose-6-phosphate isomerase n=1 Tax=Mycoemilia scoparia TaxID=417184 RepID=A0A9W8DMR4_9FUNG|nr:Mannose-6-phosphate isomerase [Mycoemilia scoparia]
MDQNIIRLSCKANNYHWGKIGRDSKVAEYASADPRFILDPHKNYSELWMGTHSNGPSVLFDDPSMSLKTLISQSPEDMLSQPVAGKYGKELPFLFKVLSINKALSIQAHPHKSLAEKLHHLHPNIYKDPNHKPEMAIALTPFEAMSGFRPLDEIAQHLIQYPEFAALVGESATKEFIDIAENGSMHDIAAKKAILRKVFERLMTRSPEEVVKQTDQLLARFPRSKCTEKGSIHELIHRLNDEYPYDLGVFCLFMLNLIHMQPGDALYMGADDPHAYISGDCVECMATSDNVVRAGLTPKLRDVPVLVDMLTYDFGSPDAKIMKGAAYSTSETTKIYDPPIEEFTVLNTKLGPQQCEHFDARMGPTILIVTNGKGSISAGSGSPLDQDIPLESGHVVFIKANTSYKLCIADDSSSDGVFETYAAFCTL